MKFKTLAVFLFFGIFVSKGIAQQTDQRIYDIIEEISKSRIEHDVKKLAGFGTRNTFSDTLSETRGIGAARRWIKFQFDSISDSCEGCLDVFYQKDFVTKEDGARVPKPAWVVNVVAI